MTREEAEQYLYYAMTIGEQLLCCGAEVGRVEDTIRRICLAYGATRADVFSITSSIVTTIYGEDFGICTQTRRVPGMANDLGRLEDLSVQLAGITGRVHNKMEKTHLLVFAADNGVVAEGVSSAPQSVTRMQTVNLTRGNLVGLAGIEPTTS